MCPANLTPSPALTPSNVFEPLLDAEQAARLLHLHPKTVQRKAKDGTIPGYKIGKRWFFRASELDSWLTHEVQSFHHPCRVKGKELQP